MGWFGNLKTGIKDLWDEYYTKRRMKKELKALELLRKMVESEEARLKHLLPQIEIVEGHLARGNFPEAERYVPAIVMEFKKKKALDELELEEFKKFQKTMFKELHAEAKKIKRQRIGKGLFV